MMTSFEWSTTSFSKEGQKWNKLGTTVEFIINLSWFQQILPLYFLKKIFFNYFKLCVCVCLTMWTRVHTPQMPETKDPHGGRLGNQKSNFSSLEEQEGLSCWAIHQPRGRIQLCGFYCLEQPSFRYDRTDSNKKIISLVKREKFFTSVVLLNVLYWLVGWFWVLFFVLVCLFWIRGLVMCTPVYAQT